MICETAGLHSGDAGIKVTHRLLDHADHVW